MDSFGFMSVNFDNDTAIPEMYERNVERSEFNVQKLILNTYSVTPTDTLNFDIHILKKDESKITDNDYSIVYSKLFKSRTPIECELVSELGNNVSAYGIWTKIEPFDVFGVCFGFKLSFQSNSPFVYTKTQKTLSASGSASVFSAENTHNDYLYPVVHITPTNTGEIFIHNTTDSQMLENGAFTIAENVSDNIRLLKAKIESYASTHGLNIQYVMDSETKDIKLLCGGICLSFYGIDIFGLSKKCFAYIKDNQYFIFRGGFFYCKTNNGLSLHIDTSSMSIADELGRAITLDELGLSDDDEIYWLRLVPGTNALKTHGSFQIDLSYSTPVVGKFMTAL